MYYNVLRLLGIRATGQQAMVHCKRKFTASQQATSGLLQYPKNHQEMIYQVNLSVRAITVSSTIHTAFWYNSPHLISR